MISPETNKIPKNISIPEVEINELEDVKKLLNNSIFKNEHNQLASKALTVDLKSNQRIEYRYNPIKLERAANFLGASGYNLLDESPSESEKILKEAAAIHERLAIVRLENDQKLPAINNIINSALLYSLAGYNANAKVLVSKILYDQDIQDHLSYDIPRVLLTYLLNGEIIKIQDRLADFFHKFSQNKLSEEEYPETEDNWINWISEKINGIGDYLTAKAFAYFINYLRTGNELYQKKIQMLTVAAGKHYKIIGDYNSYVLVHSIGRYLENLIINSTQKLIKSHLFDSQNEWKLYL